MTPVEEREEAMRMLLAEVAPEVTVRVWESARSVSGYGVTWAPGSAEGSKAAMLMTLKYAGPDQVVRCPGHQWASLSCDGVPVSWALLGHTCGRTS